MSYFSLAAFKFFLNLTFSSLTMICLFFYLFEFIVLWVTEFPEYIEHCFSIYLVKFQPLFFEIYFSVLSLSPPDSCIIHIYTNVIVHLIVFHLSLWLFSLIFILFLLFFTIHQLCHSFSFLFLFCKYVFIDFF